MKRLLIAIVCCAGLAPAAGAQSFDCSEREAIDEETICNSRTLSRLDVELSDVYEGVFANASEEERNRLRGEQRDWIETRRACGDRRPCLKRLYLDRISELEDLNEDRGGARQLGDANDGRDRWAALGAVEAGEYREVLTILVGSSRGRFDALQLRVRDASTRIRKLTVVFGNGASQSFKFRRRFRPGQLSSRIELQSRLAGRFIERIVIEASSRRRSRIEVIGRRGGKVGGNERPYAWDRDGERNDRDEYSERELYPDRDRYVEDDRYADRDSGRFEDREFEDRGFDERAERDRTLERDYDRDGDARDDHYDRGDSDDLGDRYGREDSYDRGGRNAEGDDRDTERAVVSRRRLLSFVKDVFHRTADMSQRELRETYASSVDYYGETGKPVEDVISDKRNYAERWSDRAFRVRSDTFRFEETDQPGVYELTYTYDFHVRGNGRESKGVGETVLHVDASGERYVILKEDGKVTQRL